MFYVFVSLFLFTYKKFDTHWYRYLHFQGGCDEGISLFLYRGNASKETITQLQGKTTGLREHGELIKVHVVPYEKLWRITADAKALMAITLYEMSKKEGLLPPLGS